MKKNSIKLNIIYQMAYEILVLILPLITSPYISRVLGVENIGIYSFTYSIATYFGLFALLGVKNHGNREISKCRDNQELLNKRFTSIYSVQLIFSIIVLILYLIYCFLFTRDFFVYSCIQIIYIFSCMIDIDWLYCGLEKFKISVIRSSFIKISCFVLIFVFVRTNSDLWKYCCIMSGSFLFSQIILWMNLKKYVRFCKVSIKNIIDDLKPMLVLFIPVVAVSLYNIMDKIMLGIISTKLELGFYENSEKIIFCAKTVIIAFGTVMLPRMSKLSADGDKKTMEKYINISIEFVMCIGFAIAFGISAVASKFSVVFWGDAFEACGYILAFLCVSIPFSAFANVIRTQFLIPNNRDKSYIISVIMGAIANLVVNLLLIYRYNAIGAAIGTIAAEVIVWTIQCFSVKNSIDIKKLIKKTVPFFIFGLMMFIVVKYMDMKLEISISNLLVEIFLGMFMYCFLTGVYFIWSKNIIYIQLKAKAVSLYKERRIR